MGLSYAFSDCSLCVITTSVVFLDGSRAVGVPSALRNPANGFHAADVTMSGRLSRVVAKKSSKRQWYCGDNSPVVRFRTKYTFHA